MLTFFTTPKAFTGHSNVIQRNALGSWLRLHPQVEIILFGDDEGAANACRELGIHHHPRQERHLSGMKYLNYMFERAQSIAHHDFLCYSNCDIIFLDDFYRAFLKGRAWRREFLMVGHRWDTDITDAIDFSDPTWALSVRTRVAQTGFRQKLHFVDYFLFSKGLYNHVPPLVVGRSWWDHWLV